MSRVVTVDPTQPDPAVIDEGGAILRTGGLVAFPTETVYGLGANALDRAAVDRIFAAKGRPAYNPVIVHVADRAQASGLASEWPDTADRLAEAFWPGPLTLVVPKTAAIPDNVTAGLPAVGLRVPAHPVALALIRSAGVPVAAPSANRFTELSPTLASHVASSLGDRVDLLIDGGSTDVGIESTVVDLTGERPRLLRPGMVTLAALESIVGDVAVPEHDPAAGAARLSPGQVDRHYAPRAPVYLLSAAEIDRQADRGQLGLLHHSSLRVTGFRKAIQLAASPDRYAHDLYAALHELDHTGCAAILVELPPEDGAWRAILDRLTRAAHR